MFHFLSNETCWYYQSKDSMNLPYMQKRVLSILQVWLSPYCLFALYYFFYQSPCTDSCLSCVNPGLEPDRVQHCPQQADFYPHHRGGKSGHSETKEEEKELTGDFQRRWWDHQPRWGLFCWNFMVSESSAYNLQVNWGVSQQRLGLEAT